jgi:iron-sulfur cluster assembly accessory protein
MGETTDRGNQPAGSQEAGRKGARMSEATGATVNVVALSDAAATKVRELLDREGRDDLALRIAVEPGGCSGLRYALFFDDRALAGDVRAEVSGVQVVTDKMSAPYLSGASIDYLDTLERSGFTIDNPNAKGSCACGESFH